MNPVELLKLSIETFRTHKLRSFLTVLGIVIGVMTVIAIVSLIQGMNYEVERQISSLGSNTIFLQKITWGMGRLDFEELARRPDLTHDDAIAIAGLPGVARVGVARGRQVSKIVWHGNKVTDVELQGTTPSFSAIHNYEIEAGRFINSDDSLRKHQVCVIGGYIIDNLFPSQNPLGKRLTIEGRSFTVVGTLVRKGSFLGQSQDNVIIVPITTFEKSFSAGRGVGEIMHSLSIMIQPRRDYPVERAIDEVRELMRRRHGLAYNKPDDFGINTQDTIREIYQNITRVAYIVMIAVAAISLLVGGIGIMNIMLVAVAERTREIGLRKALGATNQNILWQFLLESVLLALVGGAVGIAIGMGLAKLVEVLAHLKAAAPFWTIALGFGFSASVGIFFGIYPASRAARLNPIEALRYE